MTPGSPDRQRVEQPVIVFEPIVSVRYPLIRASGGAMYRGGQA